KQMKALVERVSQVLRELDRYTVALTPGDKQRLIKPRRGSEKIGELIATIADERKVRLPTASTAQIAAQRSRAKRYAPLQIAAESLTAALHDTIFDAESKAWRSTLAFYTALQGLASNDATLQTALEPAKQFFATGKRKPKVAAAK